MDDGFYKLDLSIAWNSSDPAWTHFDTSISYQENRTSILRLALSKDGSIVFAGDGSVTSMINFEMGAITDSDSGIIYDIKCDNDADCIVSIFDPSNGKRATVKPARAPLTPLVALGNGAFVSARKSIILLQSYGYQLEPTKMFQEYKIADNSLGVLNHALNKVYMLDVTTLVWTKLADAPLPYFKSSCAMSGDYLVAFGGYNAHGGYNPNNGTVIMNGNPPSILNVKENVWVTEYKPSTSSAAPLKGGAISIYSGVLLLVFAIITVGY
ncbi:hypothetical protein BG003_009020 [Podila horticola]|nr:hypothetical protein BG003_009020 [Podila horticola]